MNSAQDEIAEYKVMEPRETYVPFFPPCRPCGHCPACGRGYALPGFPWQTYIGDPLPRYTFV